MDRLRVLVIGSGFFGRNWLREVSACPDCTVAGLVSKHADLLSKVGEEFKVPAERRFGSLGDALARADAQAVIVAVP